MFLHLLLLLLPSLLSAAPPLGPHSLVCSDVTSYGCRPLVPRPRVPARRTNHLHQSRRHPCIPSAPSQRGFGSHHVPGVHRKSHVAHATASNFDDTCISPGGDSEFLLLSPINELKQCMREDNVQCLRNTLEKCHKLDKASKELCLAPVRALAAQYSAVKIWESMHVDTSDPEYRFLVTRSQANHRLSFHIGEKRYVGFDPDSTHAYTYDPGLLRTLKDLQSPGVKLSDMLNQLISSDKFHAHYVPVKLPGGAWNSGQWTSPPTVFEIVEALEIKDQEKRRHELDKLQKLIHKVLLERIFLLDDMIGSANFMFMLVWKFGDNEDEHIQSFLHELLMKGAPISDRNIFLNYLDMIGLEEFPEKAQDLAKYERVAAKMISYSSGDAVRSLSGLILRTFPGASMKLVSRVIDGHHQMFPHADLNSPLIMDSLHVYVTKEPKRRYSMQVAAWLADYGLKVEGLDLSSIDGTEALSQLLLEWQIYSERDQVLKLVKFYDKAFPNLDYNSPTIIKSLAEYVAHLHRFDNDTDAAVTTVVNLFFVYGLRAEAVEAVSFEEADKRAHNQNLMTAYSLMIMELNIVKARFDNKLDNK